MLISLRRHEKRSHATHRSTPLRRRGAQARNTQISDMRLYAGMSPEFVRDSTHNQIADKLKVAFRSQFRYDPPPSEIRAWQESLRALAQVFTETDLDDHGVLLEYQLPLTSRRLDCMITGHDDGHRD